MLDDIIEIICEYVEVEPETITEDSSLRGDIGATSFDLMNIAVAVEEKYGVSVTNRELLKIKTVGDVERVLTARG